MSRVIRISEKTFSRLQLLAEPLVDTPASVIDKLLNKHEATLETASQPEVRDSIFKEEMFIPWPDDEESKKRIIKNAQKVVESREQLRESLQNTTSSFEGLLKL